MLEHGAEMAQLMLLLTLIPMGSRAFALILLGALAMLAATFWIIMIPEDQW